MAIDLNKVDETSEYFTKNNIFISFNIINTKDELKFSLRGNLEQSVWCLEHIGFEVLNDRIFKVGDSYYLNVRHEEIREKYPHLYV